MKSVRTLIALLVVALLSVACQSNDKVAKEFVDGANTELPMSVDGLTIQKAYLDGKVIVMPIKIDASLGVSFDGIDPTLREAMSRNALSEIIANTRADERVALEQLADGGYSINYRMTDSYGKSIDCLITPDKIQEALKNGG